LWIFDLDRSRPIFQLKDILSKYHNYLLVVALVLSCIAISIRGGDGEVRLVLQDYPFLITLLISVSLGLVAVYFQINKRNISNLSSQIKQQSENSKEYIALIDELTERQRSVYDLIVSGKTNKEIMSELFIEKSTLKTHINQIYRKLNIKSRRELKSKREP
jgi:DNA-binding CsgD family transcriptional regulator